MELVPLSDVVNALERGETGFLLEPLANVLLYLPLGAMLGHLALSSLRKQRA